MEIIEKAYLWSGGAPAKRKSTDYIVIHHADWEKCTADDIHRCHLGKGWKGIGYHFFVRKDGRIYRGREENAIGAHASNFNDLSIGVCFEGNYETEKDMPAAQLQAGRELLAYLRQKYPAAKIKRHKDVNSTSCPGKYFPWEALLRVDTAAKAAKETAQQVVDASKVALPVVRRGDKSGYVKIVQLCLNRHSKAGLSGDGIFGEITEHNVKEFQKKCGSKTCDGIVGSWTWSKLLA